MLSGPSRIRLAGEAAPAPLPPLLADDPALVSPGWADVHRIAPEPFDLAALRLRAVVLGGNGWIWQGAGPGTGPGAGPGAAPVEDPSVAPLYARRAAAEAPHGVRDRFLDLPVRRERRRGLVFQGWGIGVYGHFLIETLPRLLLAARFPDLVQGFVPVLDTSGPAWLLEILQARFGIAREAAIRFDSTAERLALDEALILPLPLREGFHPAVGPLLEAAIPALAGAPPAAAPAGRLFVRRSGYLNPASYQRVLENEEELAAIAAEEFGFTPVCPEGEPWEAQLRLFGGAAVIVGEYGSGLHNALFAPRGARIGAIRPINAAQAQIAALRGQQVGYLTEGVSALADGRFRVEGARFRRFLAALTATAPMDSAQMGAAPAAAPAPAGPQPPAAGEPFRIVF